MSRRVTLLRSALVALGVVGALSACNALIGTRDLTYEARDATADTTTDPPDTALPPDTGPPEEDAASDGPSDAACSNDVTTDPKHCGRCGHDCQGGECVASTCQPVVLFADQTKPLGITLLNGVLYWTNSTANEVRRGLTDGTDNRQFAKSANFTRPWGITNDGTNIFFAAARSPGGVFKCPAADCLLDLQLLSAKRSFDVAVQGGVAYFTNDEDRTVSRVSLTGGNELALAAPPDPFHIAVDATDSYVTNSSFFIVRVPHTGSGAVDFGDNSGAIAGGIFVDDTRVYWNYGGPGVAGAVYSKEKSGLTPPIRYPNTAHNPLGIIADKEHVYWITLGESDVEGERVDGKLLSCTITGCSKPKLLAGGLGNGSALTQDEHTIYFTEIGANSSGRVSKVAKP